MFFTLNYERLVRAALKARSTRLGYSRKSEISLFLGFNIFFENSNKIMGGTPKKIEMVKLACNLDKMYEYIDYDV